ncbi:MAG: hypothetical protein WC455_16430 [Dehalococcoidia bacterium]|jgi:hypothetical protein
MATTITKYTSYDQYVHDGTIDLDATNIYLALVTSSYTFSAAHTVWADASANEVANGDGYTTGGAQLTNTVDTAKWYAADIAWTGLTKTFRAGILYVNATVNSIVKPLIGYILFDSTPANISIAGGTFTVQWNVIGIVTF